MNKAEIAKALGSAIKSIDSVSGGDINAAHRVVLEDGRRLFVKSHDSPPPGMFASEAFGLEWLRDGPIRVPKVLAQGESWLALEWLDMRGRPDSIAFGRALAGLHRMGLPTFGIDELQPSYLATLQQDTKPEPDWPTFYVERRLRPLCRRAKLGLDRELDQLRARVDVFGPPEKPARLHGDLWWGNVSAIPTAREAVPVIFDPAVYGGHREIDLAMLALFGGLPDALVEAYDEAWPLADGWRERIALHQLYPLAAHACLFGGGYGEQVKSALAGYL
ncbi:MAG TPA: fructosamine kinase family protein [Kofleriaceae bacterium]|nr:fructosamine kinase family protein [Kofleriaceae bacterium]